MTRKFLATGISITEVDGEEEREKQKDPNVELYYERDANEKESEVVWNSVSRSAFALSDKPCVSGKESEVGDRICAYEKLPPGNANKSWQVKGLYLQCPELEPALEWTRRNPGMKLRTDYSCVVRSQKGIRRFSRFSDRIIVRKEWVYYHGELRYDPEKASEYVAEYETWLKDHPEPSRAPDAPKRCQIPCQGVLTSISEHLYSLAQKRLVRGLGFPKEKQWSSERLIKMYQSPFKRHSYIWMIPLQARLADLLGVDYRHRALEYSTWIPEKRKSVTRKKSWRQMIGDLSAYLKDPGMTPDLRRFIRKELRLLKMEPYEQSSEDRARRLRYRKYRREALLRRQDSARVPISPGPRTFRAAGD